MLLLKHMLNQAVNYVSVIHICHQSIKGDIKRESYLIHDVGNSKVRLL